VQGQGPDEVKAKDVVHDTLADSLLFRAPSAIDTYQRRCLDLGPLWPFREEDLARILSVAVRARGVHARIPVDNSTELTGRALDAWASGNHVKLNVERPCTRTEDTFVEAIDGGARRKCLSRFWIAKPAETIVILEAWEPDYCNDQRNGRSGHHAPLGQHQGARFIPSPDRPTRFAGGLCQYAETRPREWPPTPDVAQPEERSTTSS